MTTTPRVHALTSTWTRRDGDLSHTTPAPVTRAMVEAYAKLIYTHLADELCGTLVRVSCETMSEAPYIETTA